MSTEPPRYVVRWAETATRDLRRLRERDRVRIIAAGEALAFDPRPPSCKPMRRHRGLWRIRVGAYRVIYEIRDDVLVVLVAKVGHRREVYRRM